MMLWGIAPPLPFLRLLPGLAARMLRPGSRAGSLLAAAGAPALAAPSAAWLGGACVGYIISIK